MVAERLPHICLIILFAGCLVARPAGAVDSWLIVDSDVVDAGTNAWVAFVTGDQFPIGDGVVDPARVEGLYDACGKVKQPIQGLKAEDDAVAVRAPFDGVGYHILGLTLTPRVTTLDGDVFDQYLIEERANDALQIRRQSSSRQQPVTERYTKYAKTILTVGAPDPKDEGWMKPVGHRLEIIPLTNPTQWQSGETVELQVLLDGHPWPEVPVSAGHAGQTSRDDTVRTRTNERGIASIRLSQSGHWFAKAHLIRPRDGLADYEWESFWATYTFRVKGKVDVSGSMQMLRAIHGRIDPWAVAGFLMGERALIELGLPYGSEDFLAVQHGPRELPYTAMLDGLQAATGATVGKLNLKLKEVPAEDLHCEFFRLSSGEGVSYRLNPDIVAKLMAVDGHDAESLAVRMMTMSGDELFLKAGGQGTSVPTPAPAREVSPETGRDNAQAREAALKPLIRLVAMRMREPRPTATEPAPIHVAAVSEAEETGSAMTRELSSKETSSGAKSRTVRRRGLGETLWRVDTGFNPSESKGKKGLLSPCGDASEVRVTAR